MIRSLWRTREGIALLIANALAAIVCAFLPLADHLGFELAEALTVVSALVAPFAGFAAMRLDLAAAAERRRPALAAATAGLFAVLALAPPTALILLNGLRRPLCDPAAGSRWILILPVPTAWLAATFGALVRLRFSRWKAFAVVGGVVLATVITTTLITYVGPAFFAFDHFAGYLPGPLYDETIPIGTALISFRLATVLWGAAAVTAAGALAAVDRGSRRMHATWCTALTVALIVTSAWWGTDLGWRTTDRSLNKAISGKIVVDHLVIHFPRNWPDRSVEELLRDAAFDAAQLEQALGVTPAHPLHIWMYPSAADKRRLVGAEWTSFAKPYRHEIHIHPGGYPHVPLRHELVHALAGEFAQGPWLAPGGIIPNSALIEGFAVAYDIDGGSLTLAQQAKAMHDLHIAPDLTQLFSLRGFAGEASGRAYSYAGAFIRYLSGRFGTPAMRTLYRTGDLRTLGVPAALIHDFEHMLDTVVVDASGRSTARRRFAEPSLFKRPCAREVSALVDSANALASSHLWTESLAMFDKVCALQPDDAGLVASKLNIAIRMKAPDPSQVRSIAAALWSHPNLDPSLEAATRLEVGDELWRRGDSAQAHVLYLLAGSMPVDPATHRGTIVRLRALADTSLVPIVKPLLIDNEAFTSLTLRMMDALARRPHDALVLYLLARQVRSAQDRAADYMERADSIGLGNPELVRENLRTLVAARADRNRCDDAENARSRLRAAAGSAADDAVAADWVARCRFAVARGWNPMQ